MSISLVVASLAIYGIAILTLYYVGKFIFKGFFHFIDPFISKPKMMATLKEGPKLTSINKEESYWDQFMSPVFQDDTRMSAFTDKQTRYSAYLQRKSHRAVAKAIFIEKKALPTSSSVADDSDLDDPFSAIEAATA